MRAERVAAVLALTSAALTFWLFSGLRFDDAYITLQFARNVADGHGFVFNEGQRVFGSTSPLHVLVLAGVYALKGDVLAPAAVLIGAAAVGAQAFLLFLMFARTSRPLAWLVGGLVLAGFISSYYWLALETNLLAALVLGVLWALSNRREILSGALLGLAFLCRYDAALLVPICVAVWWLDQGTFPKRLLVAAFVVVAPWLVWAMFYFGSFMPQTFYAKEHITPPLTYLATALVRFADTPWVLLPAKTQIFLAMVTPIFWVSGVLFVWFRARHVLGLFLYGGALLLAYSWIGPFTTQSWHLYLTEMALGLLFVLGSSGWLLVHWHSNSRRPRALWVLPAGIISALLLSSSIGQTAELVKTYPTEFWLGKRQSRYVEVARWLRTEIQPSSIVMAPEVGTLGYLSGFRMVDPFGLINGTNNYPRAMTTDNLAEFVEWSHPDVLVLDSPSQGAVFEQRSPFRMVKVFEWDPWSTVLVRAPEVLIRPSDFDVLRADLPERVSGRF